MAVNDTETLRGKLFALSTVNIRSVLRWLNNNVKRTMEPASISPATHQVAYTHIITTYTDDDIEAAIYTIENSTPAMVEAREPVSVEQKVLVVDKKKKSKDDIAKEIAAMLGDDTMDDERVKSLIMDAMLPLDRALSQLTGVVGNKVSMPDFERYKGSVAEVVEAKMRTLRNDIGKDFGDFKGDVAKNLGDLRKFVEDYLKSSRPTELVIKPIEKPELKLGLVHRSTPKLISYLHAGVNVFLTGPAGSGKSTGAELAAKALQLPFYAISVCAQSTKTDFLGYMDATGNYRPTQFRLAFENGGAYLIDEIDAGNPNVLAVLNAALSGGLCAFPDKMVVEHKDFRLVAAGNTWGTGKTVQYVGRNAIDGATLNRFAVLLWDYDEALEKHVCGNPKWAEFVQKCRAEVKARGINFLITPRASIFGAQLLRAGVPVSDIIDDVVMPNLDPEVKSKMPKFVS